MKTLNKKQKNQSQQKNLTLISKLLTHFLKSK